MVMAVVLRSEGGKRGQGVGGPVWPMVAASELPPSDGIGAPWC